jgi:hypothetical protein
MNEELLFMCRLYLESHRAQDTLSAMKQLIDMDPGLPSPARVLFQDIYQQSFDRIHAKLRALTTARANDILHNQVGLASFLSARHQALTEQLQSSVSDAIHFIDRVLLPNALESEAAVFLQKSKANFLTSLLPTNTDLAQQVHDSYDLALDLSSRTLVPGHSLRIDLMVTFARFLLFARSDPPAARVILAQAIKEDGNLVFGLDDDLSLLADSIPQTDPPDAGPFFNGDEQIQATGHLPQIVEEEQAGGEVHDPVIEEEEEEDDLQTHNEPEPTAWRHLAAAQQRSMAARPPVTTRWGLFSGPGTFGRLTPSGFGR